MESGSDTETGGELVVMRSILKLKPDFKTILNLVETMKGHLFGSQNRRMNIVLTTNPILGWTVRLEETAQAEKHITRGGAKRAETW